MKERPVAYLNVLDTGFADTDTYAVPDGEWVVLKAEQFPEKLGTLYNLTYQKGDILLCLRRRLGKHQVRLHVISKLNLTDARMLAIALAYASIGPEV